MNLNIKNRYSSAFTVIELIIVIIVIGILATVTIVAYNGIQQNAHKSALMSDLDNSAAIMARDFNANGAYAATVAAADGGNGLPTTSGTTYQYTVNNSATPPSFCLTGTNNNIIYYINSNSDTPKQGVCPVLYYDASVASSYPGSGTTWTDLSGNGNIGTLNGGVSYSSTAGGALSFNGSTGYVSAPDSSYLDFGTGDFSVSFWCYRTASGYQGGSYLVKGPYGTPGIESYDGGFYVNTVNGNLAHISLSPSYNVWENHVLVVTQSSTPHILHYINGVLNQTGYVDGGASGSINSTSGLIIGKSSAGGVNRYYIGLMGSIYIYSKALTQNEINQNFNAQRSRYGV